MTTLEPERRTRPRRAAASVEDDRAVVARTTPDGEIATAEILASSVEGSDFLTRVARTLGPQDTLFVAGREHLRTEFERRHVGLYRRPDCLVDLPGDAPVSKAELVEQLTSDPEARGLRDTDRGADYPAGPGTGASRTAA